MTNQGKAILGKLTFAFAKHYEKQHIDSGANEWEQSFLTRVLYDIRRLGFIEFDEFKMIQDDIAAISPRLVSRKS